MNYTQNLHLPQFAETDRIHHDDFNTAFAAIDTAVAGKSGVAFGAYNGDGTAERTITLGFTPKIVYLCTRWGLAGNHSGDGYCYGGLVERDHPIVHRSQNCAEIVNGGFVVRTPNGFTRMNSQSEVYYYVAIV